MKVIIENKNYFTGGSASESGKSNLSKVITPDLFNGDILEMKNSFKHGINSSNKESGPFFGENPYYILTYTENKNIY